MQRIWNAGPAIVWLLDGGWWGPRAAHRTRVHNDQQFTIAPAPPCKGVCRCHHHLEKPNPRLPVAVVVTSGCRVHHILVSVFLNCPPLHAEPRCCNARLTPRLLTHSPGPKPTLSTQGAVTIPTRQRNKRRRCESDFAGTCKTNRMQTVGSTNTQRRTSRPSKNTMHQRTGSAMGSDR